MNKFSFAAGIACIYDIVGFVDQFAYYRKLVRVAAVVCLAAVLSFALSHPEVEVFRQYGQRVYHPRDIRLRSEYLHQVTEGPGYGISIAGHISLTPHLRAHDTGQVPSHRRLLGNDCNHLTVNLYYFDDALENRGHLLRGPLCGYNDLVAVGTLVLTIVNEDIGDDGHSENPHSAVTGD